MMVGAVPGRGGPSQYKIDRVRRRCPIIVLTAVVPAAAIPKHFSPRRVHQSQWVSVGN